MKLIWSPPNGERREFQFTPAKMLSVDAEAVEALGGDVWDNFDDFGAAFNRRSRRAIRAALWVCLRQADGAEAPAFEALSLTPYEVQVDFGDDELARIREVLLSGEDIDPAQRAVFVEWLGEDPVEAGPKEASPSDSPPPPTGSEPDGAPTGGPSPDTSTARRPSRTPGPRKSSSPRAKRSTN